MVWKYAQIARGKEVDKQLKERTGGNVVMVAMATAAVVRW